MIKRMALDAGFGAGAAGTAAAGAAAAGEGLAAGLLGAPKAKQARRTARKLLMHIGRMVGGIDCFLAGCGELETPKINTI
jgi:hypothetical protein